MAFTLKPITILRPRASAVTQTNGIFTQVWYGWFRDLIATLTANQNAVAGQLNAGFTGVITTAKLTATGTNGTMTFTNGILTAETPAT